MKNFNSMFDTIKKERIIISNPISSKRSTTTIFLGLYKGEDLWRPRLEEILNQTYQEFDLLIVDNNTEGFNINDVVDYVRSNDLNSRRWTVVKNPLNLGGLGSVQLNVDLVSSDWITFFHQDDLYLNNHVELHTLAMLNAGLKCNSVSSDMGSVDAEGKRLPSTPRASWLLVNNSNFDIFLASLSMQVIPFPAASFRKSILNDCQVPMHESGFSDSEISLMSLMRGYHYFISEETMLYQDNPIGESKMTTQSTRQMAAFLGLTRILNSSDFLNFVSNVPVDERGKFVRQVYSAFEFRITHRQMSNLVKIIATDRLIQAWGYDNDLVAGLTESLARALDDTFTINFMDNISYFFNLTIDSNSKHQFSEIDKILSLEKSDSNSVREKPSARNRCNIILVKALNLFPNKFRRNFFRIALVFLSKINYKNSWTSINIKNID